MLDISNIKILYIESSRSSRYWDFFISKCRELIDVGHAYEPFMEHYSNSDRPAFVALDNDIIVGFMSFEPYNNILRNGFVYIEPEYRRTNLGRVLKNEIRDWGIKNKFAGMTGVIKNSNRASLAFFKNTKPISTTVYWEF